MAAGRWLRSSDCLRTCLQCKSSEACDARDPLPAHRVPLCWSAIFGASSKSHLVQHADGTVADSGDDEEEADHDFMVEVNELIATAPFSPHSWPVAVQSAERGLAAEAIELSLSGSAAIL